MIVKLEQTQAKQTVEKNTTSYNTSKVSRTDTKSGYALDISGTVMDNSAYKGQGKTAEEVMQNAEQINLATQRNYMTVMSNSMSAEDFAKLQEEGFDIGSVDVEKIVTVVDKIKAELLEAGIEIEGYTDDLNEDKLQQIAGNVSRAIAIENKLKEYDLPDTKKNIEELNRALQEALSLSKLSEGTMKYMVENQMPPTIDNTYKAQFSSTQDGNRQGRGYFSEDMNGYYAKKADDYNWEQLQTRMEEVIKEAGIEVNEESMENAKWLVEKGVPLTKETLQLFEDLKQVKLPKEEGELIDTIAKAMANGEKAKDANLLEQPYFAKQAVETKKTRQLEEIRLQMTVEANLKLLKKGISIDTMDLEQLVEELKKIEEETAKALFEDTEKASLDKKHLYDDTLRKVSDIKFMPSDVIGHIAKLDKQITLDGVYEQGKALQKTYEEYEKTFEAVMTAPRKDLGDSIKKAFRNVDDILQDMGKELTDMNRRAIRILGYNNMEITERNLFAVKEADLSLQKLLNKLTPAATMDLIRKNINPLETDMNTLEQEIDKLEKPVEKEAEKYAKFLHKLEQNNEITKEERDAYVGIYRLIRQIEKSDGAVIGSLVNQGAEINFKNLLSAVRTNKQKGMNVTLDKDFGALQETHNRDNTISSQIENYYNKLAQEIGEKLEPEKITTLEITVETTLEQLAQMLNQEMPKPEAEKRFLEEKLNDVRKSEMVEDYIIQSLLDYNQPVNVDNLLAADTLINHRGELFKEMKKQAEKLDKQKEEPSDSTVSQTEKSLVDLLDGASKDIQNSFTDKESANAAYQQLQETVSKMADISIDIEHIEAKDMKALSLLYKQISFATRMAQEENYEIPLEINGEITSVNLKILHNKNDFGKVVATMETESYGKVAAQFTVKDKQVTGYIVASDKEKTEQLENINKPFKQLLEKTGLEVGQMNVIQSSQVDIQRFGREETKPSEKPVSNKELYQIAKSFITVLQES